MADHDYTPAPSRRAFIATGVASMAAVPAAVISTAPADPVLPLFASWKQWAAQLDALSDHIAEIEKTLLHTNTPTVRVKWGKSSFDISSEHDIRAWVSTATYDAIRRSHGGQLRPSQFAEHLVALEAEAQDFETRARAALEEARALAAAEREGAGLQLLWGEMDAVYAAMDELSDQILATSATSPEGVAAKLHVLRRYGGVNFEAKQEPDDMEWQHRLFFSALEDLQCLTSRGEA